MDLKAIVELEDNLIESFQLVRCPVCDTLTLHGVMINGQENQSATYWHADCYQHYITHVGHDYLGTSLITNGIYVI